jgi:hypothetical protein
MFDDVPIFGEARQGPGISDARRCDPGMHASQAQRIV